MNSIKTFLTLLVVSGLSFAGSGRFDRFTSRTDEGRAARGATKDITTDMSYALSYLNFDNNKGSIPLCDALPSSKKTGAWWCLKGDGTMDVGSPKTLIGSGVSQRNVAVCGNGGDCGVMAAQTLPLSTGVFSEASASPTVAGDMTVCTLAACSKNNVGEGCGGMTHTSSTGSSPATTDWQLFNTTQAAFYTSTGAAFVSAFGPATGTEITLLCGTILSGTGYAYTNGAIGAGVDMSARQTSVSGRVTVNGLNGSPFAGWRADTMLGAFFIPYGMTKAELDAIYAAVLPKPTDNWGRPIVEQRSTQAFCPNSANEGNDLPPNRPCISRGGIGVFGGTTFDLLYNEDITNAVWTLTGTGTRAANIAMAPNGIYSANTLTDSDGAAKVSISQTVASTSLTKHVSQVYVKAISSSSTVTITQTGTGNSAGDCSTSASVPTTGWTHLFCVSPTAYTTGLTNITTKIEFGGSVSDQGSVLVWRPEHEASATTPTPPSAVAGVAVVRGGDSPYIDLGASGPLRADSMSMAESFFRQAPYGSQTGSGYLFPNHVVVASLLSGSSSALGFISPGWYGTICTPGIYDNSGAVTWLGNQYYAPRNALWTNGATGYSLMSSLLSAPFSGTYTTPLRYLRIGDYLGGWISNVCVDSNPLKCR